MNKWLVSCLLLSLFCVTEKVFGEGGKESVEGIASEKKQTIVGPQSSFPRFSISWGYNRTAFTRSTLNFSGPGYDFSLQGMTAKDRPSSLRSGDYTKITRISIPQYNYAVGFQIDYRWGVTLGMDHIKYVMNANQTSHLSGVIDSSVSPVWAGTWKGESVTVNQDFLSFEHTDGLNYLVAGVRYSPISEKFRGSGHQNLAIPKVYVRPFVGLDLGILIPRTDVRIFGYGLNNRFHIAGIGTSANIGGRATFFRNLFLQANVRGGFVTLPSVLIHNDAPDRAHHHFGFLEGTVAIGFAIWSHYGRPI